MAYTGKDGLLAPDGDLAIYNGDLVLVTGADAIREQWLIRVRKWQGEWVLDTEDGVPYRQEIFSKQSSAARVEEIFRDVTLQTPGVLSVESVRFDITDEINREVSIEVDATIDGPESITFQYQGDLPLGASSGSLPVGYPSSYDDLRVWLDSQDLGNLSYNSPLTLNNKAGTGSATGDCTLQGVSDLGNKRSAFFDRSNTEKLDMTDTEAIRHGTGAISIVAVVKRSDSGETSVKDFGILALDGYDHIADQSEFYHVSMRGDDSTPNSSRIVFKSDRWQPYFYAFGSAAPVGYTQAGHVFYDSNNDKIYVPTDNGMYEYDIVGDSWTNLGGSPRVAFAETVGIAGGSILTIDSTRTLIQKWTGASWVTALSNSGFFFRALRSDATTAAITGDVNSGSGRPGVYTTTDGSTFTPFPVPYTTGNDVEKIIDYGGAAVAVVFPRNQALEADVAQLYNAGWSVYDSSLGGKYRAWFCEVDNKLGNTDFVISHNNFTDATWKTYRYNAGVRTTLRTPTENESVVVIDGGIYTWGITSAVAPILRKWDGVSAWDDIVTFPGASTNFYKSCCVHNDEPIFMGATGLQKVKLTQ
jgi:hypothetical protein